MDKVSLNRLIIDGSNDLFWKSKYSLHDDCYRIILLTNNQLRKKSLDLLEIDEDKIYLY